MSVVAQAGAWTVSVPIIAPLVTTTDAVALAASLSPSSEYADGVAVMATSGANSV